MPIAASDKGSLCRMMQYFFLGPMEQLSIHVRMEPPPPPRPLVWVSNPGSIDSEADARPTLRYLNLNLNGLLVIRQIDKTLPGLTM